MPPLPKSPLGHVVGTGTQPKLILEVFIDLVCPFSARIFKRLYNEVLPAVEKRAPGAVHTKFYSWPQPWHYQSTTVHEASLAVKAVAPEKFFDYVGIVCERIEEFYDSELQDTTRTQLVKKLAGIAGELGVDASAVEAQLQLVKEGRNNGGCAVTSELKFHTRYGRSRGIHVSPTCVLNGIQDDSISSSWTNEQWAEYFDNLLA